MIPGVQFFFDEDGQKRSVLIDLEAHGDLWEDFYACYLGQTYKDESARPWEEVKQELGLGNQ